MIIWDLSRVVFIIAKYQVVTKFLYSISSKRKIYLYRFFEILIYPVSIFKPKNEEFGVSLRKAFIELGPIYIKLGQTISANPNLAGNRLAEELKFLQDKLEPFEYKFVEEILLASFNKPISELFAEFEITPRSAASIAQVHHAKTKDGIEIAVKILRPGIHLKYQNDIKVLCWIAKNINKMYPNFHRLKFNEIIIILQQVMDTELNLLLEAAAATELKRNSLKNPNIYIPKIFWKLTTRNVLTSEWINGHNIYQTINENKLDSEMLAENLAIIFFNQAFRDGFFHGDLHPGNILIKPDGTIALIDFGIMGRLYEKERLIIAELLYRFLNHEYLEVAKLHLKAGYIPHNSNLELFAQNCQVAYEELVESDPASLSISSLLKNLFKITEDFGMQTQPQLFLLQKSMIVVEGIGRLLSPNKNMWELAKPHITKWAIRNLSIEAKILRVLRNYINKFDI